MIRDTYIRNIGYRELENILKEELKELKSDWAPGLRVSVLDYEHEVSINVEFYGTVLEPSYNCANSVEKCLDELNINPKDLDVQLNINGLIIDIYTFKADDDYSEYGVSITIVIPDKYSVTVNQIINWIKTIYDITLTVI